MAEFEPMRVTMKVTESDETHSMTAHEQTEQYSMKLTSSIEPKLSDDYADLTNKPIINDVTLEGDLTSADLGLQDELVFDSYPEDGSENPVTSGGIALALDTKVDKTTLAPGPVTATINNADGIVTIDSAKNTGSLSNRQTRASSVSFDGDTISISQSKTSNGTVIDSSEVSVSTAGITANTTIRLLNPDSGLALTLDPGSGNNYGLISGLRDPANSNDAANKAYVDSGLSTKADASVVADELDAKQDTIYLTDDSSQQYVVTSMEEVTVGGVHGFMLYAENVSWFFPDGVGLNTVLTSVNTAIAGKQPVGDYATNSALTSGLATKQPVGDYATNSDLNSGLAAKQNVLTFDSAPTSGSTNPVESGGVYTALAGKQNSGDYATNTALTTGLAAKQDAGDYAASAPGDTTHTAIRAAGILFGEVDDTSTATAYTATIPGVTAYYDGLAIMLKNGVVTSAAGFTIDINGLGAKHSYNNLAAATADTTIFNVAYTMLFVYDSTRVSGGGWICYRGYDANTNTIGYQVRTNSTTMPMKSVTYRYRLLFTAADGQGFVPANNSTSTNATAIRAVCQDKIDPFGPIYYYGTTAAVAAGSRPGAAYLWQQYVVTLGYSFNRTGAALALTTYKPVYAVANPQSDGSAILDADTPYTQALPTTQDGKIYIFLGVSNAATTIELNINHPVYCYKDGGIRPWDGYVITTA